MLAAEHTLDQPSLIHAVRELFQEGAEGALKRETTAFDSAALDGMNSLVLFGAGNLGRKTLTDLRKAGVEPLAFTDSNSQLWDTCVDGLRVLSPGEAARRYGPMSTFVITIWTGEGHDRMRDRRRQLEALGCRRVIPFTFLFWKYADLFLPHYTIDLPHRVYDQAREVTRAAELWSDDASRFEYLAQLRWRLLSDFDVLPHPVQPPTYFPRDLFELREQELFVDCGAYDGDTIKILREQPSGSSASVCAFEADRNNFEKLEKTVASMTNNASITIYNLAVGASNGSVMLRALGSQASYVSQSAGDTLVDCVTLDDKLGDLEPTFVKMDIEGAELDALKGASNIIRCGTAVFAICTYHQQDHLWKIPLFIQSLRHDYRFYLRPHLLEGWDLVCYAVPPHRMKATERRTV
jgi:FkbM family methyltransferase